MTIQATWSPTAQLNQNVCVQPESFTREETGVIVSKINLPLFGGWIRVSPKQHSHEAES